jgi:hypothetical protein
LIHGPWNISGRRDLSISMRITMSLFSRWLYIPILLGKIFLSTLHALCW